MEQQAVTGTIYGPYIRFGCDPELFIEDKDGKIVGAERFIPLQPGHILGGRVALDGVQLELHPDAQMCRANLGNAIQYIFQDLKARLERDEYKEKGYRLCFRTTVEVSKKEHASLSPTTRRLGCMPSFNVYNRSAGINVNPLTYRTRSAGGHIHLGGLPFKLDPEGDIAKRFVRILDIVVGNTCVLIDRDEKAAIRRRNYGRAGEYRLPSWGLEYRVLSNFWLRSYQLFSLVTGLCRLATGIMYANLKRDSDTWHGPKWDAENILLNLVDRDDIVKAINKNDYDLAYANLQRIKPFLRDYCHDTEAGLSSGVLGRFEHFLARLKEKGIEYWFPEDPLEHWCNKREGHGIGWESFLINTVANDHDRAAQAELTSAMRQPTDPF